MAKLLRRSNVIRSNTGGLKPRLMKDLIFLALHPYESSYAWTTRVGTSELSPLLIVGLCILTTTIESLIGLLQYFVTTASMAL